MLKRNARRSISNFISCLLSGVLLCGCSTRTVRFTSRPAGALVSAGKRTGTTPCCLKVRKDVQEVVFELPTGEQIAMPIGELDSDLEVVADASGKVVGGSLMLVGGTVAVLGAGLLVLWAGAEEDDGFNDQEEDWEDNTDIEVAGAGLGLLLAGGGVYYLGKWIFPDEPMPLVHADFGPIDPEENAYDDDSDRYEDHGYGALRLKKKSGRR